MKKKFLALISIVSIGLCFVGCKDTTNTPDNHNIIENISTEKPDNTNVDNINTENIKKYSCNIIETEDGYTINFIKDACSYMDDAIIKEGYTSSLYVIPKDTITKSMELEKQRILNENISYKNIDYNSDFSDVTFYLDNNNYNDAIKNSDYMADCIFNYQKCLGIISTSFKNNNLDIILNYINVDTNKTTKRIYSKGNYKNALTDETQQNFDQLVFSSPKTVIEKNDTYEVTFDYYGKNNNNRYNYAEWVASWYSTNVSYNVTKTIGNWYKSIQNDSSNNSDNTKIAKNDFIVKIGFIYDENTQIIEPINTVLEKLKKDLSEYVINKSELIEIPYDQINVITNSINLTDESQYKSSLEFLTKEKYDIIMCVYIPNTLNMLCELANQNPNSTFILLNSPIDYLSNKHSNILCIKSSDSELSTYNWDTAIYNPCLENIKKMLQHKIREAALNGDIIIKTDYTNNNKTVMKNWKPILIKNADDSYSFNFRKRDCTAFPDKPLYEYISSTYTFSKDIINEAKEHYKNMFLESIKNYDTVEFIFNEDLSEVNIYGDFLVKNYGKDENGKDMIYIIDKNRTGINNDIANYSYVLALVYINKYLDNITLTSFKENDYKPVIKFINKSDNTIMPQSYNMEGHIKNIFIREGFYIKKFETIKAPINIVETDNSYEITFDSYKNNNGNLIEGLSYYFSNSISYNISKEQFEKIKDKSINNLLNWTDYMQKLFANENVDVHVSSKLSEINFYCNSNDYNESLALYNSLYKAIPFEDLGLCYSTDTMEYVKIYHSLFPSGLEEEDLYINTMLQFKRISEFYAFGFLYQYLTDTPINDIQVKCNLVDKDTGEVYITNIYKPILAGPESSLENYSKIF